MISCDSVVSTLPVKKELHRFIDIYHTEGLAVALGRAGTYVTNRIDPISGYNNNLRYTDGILPKLGIICRYLFGVNYYKRYLEKQFGNPILVSTNGYQMHVDLKDSGISNEILFHGTHEHVSTRAFASVLADVADRASGEVTVLEIGANIGYYLLLEANILGEKANIHAFEPDPKNRALLKKNIKYNGYSDQISVLEQAVSASEERADLAVTRSSNKNYLLDDSGVASSEKPISSVYAVETTSIDSYLRAADIHPAEVDVIRMDVQGHEYEILQGMCEVLRAGTDLVLFLETHGNFVGETKQREIVETLRDAGLQVIHAADNFTELDVKSVEQLRERDCEVILCR